jgi:hypothetical protein
MLELAGLQYQQDRSVEEKRIQDAIDEISEVDERR